jgi:hypothetical protein
MFQHYRVVIRQQEYLESHVFKIYAFIYVLHCPDAGVYVLKEPTPKGINLPFL